MFNLISNQSIPTEPHHYSKNKHNYHINLYQYNRIKNWLEFTTKNYYDRAIDHQFNPNARNQDEYTTSTYVYSFKIIYMDDQFVSKNYRMINKMAELMVIANIFDETKKCYITQSFEKKSIQCLFDQSANSIKLNSPLIMGFYTEHHKNITKFGQHFLINLQIVCDDGEVFELGTTQHDLSQRPKHLIRDHELKKMGDVVGKVEFMIDSPDQDFSLKHLIPAFRIISQENNLNTIPPCKSFSLHNKFQPFIVGDVVFPIVMNDFIISFKGYEALLKTIQKYNSLFLDFYYEDIQVQILEFRALIGYHNSWMFLTAFDHINKQKKQSPKNSPSKSRKKDYPNENKSLSKSKTIPKLSLSKFYQLKPNSQQANPDQITLRPNIDNLALQYFHVPGGHLALVLQAKVKHTLNGTIRQDKIEVYNLGWHPLVFNLEDNQSNVGFPLITHQLKLPGFQNELLKYDKNLLKEHNFCVSYKMHNNNEALHKTMRKETHKMKQFGSLMKVNVSISDIGSQEESIRNFPLTLRGELDKKIQIQAQRQQNLRVNRKHKPSKITSEQSLPIHKKFEHIVQLLKHLDKNVKSRIIPSGLQIPIPADDTNYFPSKSEILKKSIKIAIKFYGILPHTSTIDTEHPHFKNQPVQQSQSLSDYYIPRTLIIEFFVHGQHFSFLASIDNSKSSARYCVPIQMNCSKVINHYEENKKVSYSHIDFDSIIQGKTTSEFQLTFTVKNQEQYNRILQIPILCQVYDAANYQHYGTGQYPYVCLLSQATKSYLSSNIEKDREQSDPSSAQINIKSKESESMREADNMVTINSKKIFDGIYHEGLHSNIKNFKIELYGGSDQQVSNHLLGSLLFTANAQINNIKGEGLENTGVKIEPFKIQSIAKQLSVKERQLLRINNYNRYGGGQGNITIDKNVLINKYRENNHQKYVDTLVRNQCYNDIVIQYTTGRPTYEWVEFTNTDTSGNDVFTFEITCDYIELVIDAHKYKQQAAIEISKKPNKTEKLIRKNPYLTFHQAQNNFGYFEGRIVYGQKFSLLLKVYHEEWSYNIQKVKIVNFIAKRNKQPYSNMKIRLNYQEPIISHISHLFRRFDYSQVGIIVSFPQQKHYQKFSDNMKSLTSHVSYNKKLKSLVIDPEINSKNRAKVNKFSVEEDFLPFQGKVFDVLLGFYWDKKFQNLMKTILVRIEILSGQRHQLHIGQILNIDIPYHRTNIPVNARIYRIETSSNKLLYKESETQTQFKILSINARTTQNNTIFESSQPRVMICPLKPTKKQQLVISVISTEGKLLRKYLLEFSCKISHTHQQQLITMEGFKGEKEVLILRNPYQIEYGFKILFSSQELFRIRLLSSVDREQITDPNFLFKIQAKSHIKISVQLRANVSKSYAVNSNESSVQNQNKEYAVLVDCNRHVVGIYTFTFIERQSHQNSVRVANLHSYQNHHQKSTIQQQKLFSLFGNTIMPVQMR